MVYRKEELEQNFERDLTIFFDGKSIDIYDGTKSILVEEGNVVEFVNMVVKVFLGKKEPEKGEQRTFTPIKRDSAGRDYGT